MGNVVDITAKLPHKTGQIKCLHCGHESTQVIALKDDQLAFDCSECGLEKAVWAGITMPLPDEERLACETCDGEFFYVLRNGECMCVECGARTDA